MTDPLLLYALIILGLCLAAVVLWPPNWIRVAMWSVGPQRQQKFIDALLAEIEKEPNVHAKNFYAWMLTIALAERNL